MKNLYVLQNQIYRFVLASYMYSFGHDMQVITTDV